MCIRDRSGDVRKSIDGLRMIILKLLRSGPMYKDDFCYFMGVSLITVSYTHLDVYKRQIKCFSFSLLFKASKLACCAIAFIQNIVQIKRFYY